MPNLTHKLTHLLEPSNSSPKGSRRGSNSSPLPRTVTMDSQHSGYSSPGDVTPPKEKSKRSNKPPAFLAKMLGPFYHIQCSTNCHSNVASSGEVFGLLKALAADQADAEGVDMAATTSTPSSATSGEIVETPEEGIINAGAPVDLDKTSQGHHSVETLHQKDILAAQLTALSMNNMSPLADSDHNQTQMPPLDSAIVDDEASEAGPSILRDPELEGIAQASDEEKLKAIQEEFGDVASEMVDKNTGASEPERLLAEAKGSFFREVMMLGHLHLTTHRLLFHALLPPNPAEYVDDTTGAANDGASGSSHPVVLMNGPVTYHHSNALKPARRVWMEVGPEMITTYPRGDDAGRTRPLRCILLSSVRKMEPLSPQEPCDFYLTYESQHGFSKAHFTVDTQQSAMQWRRQLEGALFHNAKRIFFQTSAESRQKDSWMMMRCCVPLERVRIDGVTEYHSFATLVNMEIAWGDAKVHSSWLSQQLSLGDPMWDNTGDSLPDSGYATPRMSMSDDTAPPTRATTLPIAVGDGKPISPSPLSLSDSEKPRSGTPTLSSLLPRRSTSRSGQSPSRSGSSSPKLSASPRSSVPWLNSAVPAVLQRAKDNAMLHGDTVVEPKEPPAHEFKVAVLNETVWFVDAFVKAVHNAHHREYKEGAKPAKLRFEVGGHDCLATDEELEQSEPLERLSDESADFDDLHTSSVSGIRKAEVIAMAAKVFGFQPDAQVWIKRCYIAGVVPARGHILITKEFLCFWRRATLGEDIKYRFTRSDIKGADSIDAARSAFHGMALHIHGRPDLHFEFWQKKSRDEVIQHVRQMIGPSPDSTFLGLERTMSPTSATSDAASETTAVPLVPLEQMPTREFESKQDTVHAADILALPKNALSESKTFKDTALPYLPFIANLPSNFRYKLSPRHFVLLTIGSRGDVQPYIALGLRLKKDGHRVTIVTHDEFKKWITGYGIEHRQAGGDPTALMKLSAEHKMFSPGFFKESLGSFRQWLDDLLLDSWIACHDADVLIESPSTMSGIHIAEALAIPYFRAFTMPWTRTNAYPQAFMVPAFEMGPSFNYSTYVLFDNIIWRATAGQINRWRRNHLRLKATDLSVLSTSQVPFLYNFSSAVVPKPLDWHDNISITGYWNLEDSDTDWAAPKDLEDFIAKAKADGKALVYIGFGSIVVPDPNRITKSIIKGVEKAGVRAIIAKGWSSRGSTPAAEGKETTFPPSCYSLEKVPHGWLFPKVNAAMHHGGAGTVGASLRAGLPTIIKPWFGDQFFWAQRVTKLGAGLKLGALRSEDIASALKEATTSKVMIEKAARIGQRIRTENGVENALETISYNISRAAEDRRTMQWQK